MEKIKSIALPRLFTFRIEYVLSFFAFLVPLTLNGQQLLTGTAVNMLLFFAASRVSTKSALPIVLLPSLGALLNGVVFGSFTPYLLYFLPAIWIGNAGLVYLYQVSKNISPVFRIVAASTLKAGLLFSVALVLNSIHIVPSIFLTAMGVFQLVTALSGGFLFLGISKLILKSYERSI